MSLLDKIQAQEANPVEVEKKRPAVHRIAQDTASKDKQISAKVNDTMYQRFTQINKAQGLSNNSALNMIINRYVRENMGLLEEYMD